MSREVIINGNVHELPNQGENPPWGEDLSDLIYDMTSVLVAAISPSDVLTTVYEFQNGGEEEIGATFLSSDMLSFEMKYSVSRETKVPVDLFVHMSRVNIDAMLPTEIVNFDFDGITSTFTKGSGVGEFDNVTELKALVDAVGGNDHATSIDPITNDLILESNTELTVPVIVTGDGVVTERSVLVCDIDIDWVSATSYHVGDLIKNVGVYYECIADNSDVVFTPANWVVTTNKHDLEVGDSFTTDVGFLSGYKVVLDVRENKLEIAKELLAQSVNKVMILKLIENGKICGAYNDTQSEPWDLSVSKMGRAKVSFNVTPAGESEITVLRMAGTEHLGTITFEAASLQRI